VNNDPLELNIAPFSNSGADVAAPGVDILSASVGGGLAQMSGTSMAANHVVGIAALWAEKQLSTRGRIDVSELSGQLRASATTRSLIEGVSPGDVGSGLVQAPKS
jgi:subtilisin family serine protease